MGVSFREGKGKLRRSRDCYGLPYMRPISVWSVGVMHSQFQVAAGDVWVSFKSEPSQFQTYLSTSEREQFSANFITVVQKHMPALSERDSVIIFC